MFLSIVIPIYNDEKFLEECLDSCLNQELSKDDYEIICVDDGSTDRTPEILKQYAQRFPNIRVITKQHGSQFGGGRDIGFDTARGDYVWFVDHDDLIAPQALKLLKKASTETDDADRFSFPYYLFYNSLTASEKAQMRDGSLKQNTGDSLRSLTLWSGVIKLSFLRENHLRPTARRIAAAKEYWGISPFRAWGGDNLSMEEYFDCGMRTKNLDCPPLYFYRRHENAQTMNLTKEVRRSRDALKYNNVLVRLYEAIQWKQKYLEEQAQSGQATEKTTGMMLWKIRNTVSRLARLPRREWKAGRKQLYEKDLLFRRKPPEYQTGFSAYLKSRSRKERLLPSAWAFYYLYHPLGVGIYRFLTSFGRITSGTPLLQKIYRALKQKRK